MIKYYSGQLSSNPLSLFLTLSSTIIKKKTPQLSAKTLGKLFEGVVCNLVRGRGGSINHFHHHQLIMTTGLLATAHTITLQLREAPKQRTHHSPQLVFSKYHLALSLPPYLCLSSHVNNHGRQPLRSCYVLMCLPSSSSSSPSSSSSSSTKLYVSGLSFRTTQESLRNAFQQFGQLIEVNLVMDRIANRPRGFAFLRYATEEESKKAIEGMHGKFLDGRVIFVEVAKPRSEVQKNKQKS